jgi:D-sedoheptulose 7-phosphate isomerase
MNTMAEATSTVDLVSAVATHLRARNRVSSTLFPAEADRLSAACREMSDRFLRGGRLLAFGNGPWATDAQHVSVEFVHPVIVGKRALPALDLSLGFESRVPALLRPEDVVMGFGPPEGDETVWRTLTAARERGAQAFALPGRAEDVASADPAFYAVASPSDDPDVHQEMIEVLYHVLWETVHVFFEHQPSRGGSSRTDEDVGASSFLYPYLSGGARDTSGVLTQVADSIRVKAADDEALREEAATRDAGALVAAARAVAERIAAGGAVLTFGNGGSATDANDLALDCAAPPAGRRPIPAVSLALEPANITAIANDVGVESVFTRQLLAHARPGDVAVAFSTSGGSGNVLHTLAEARKRGLATVAFLGYDGGEIVRRGLADHPLVVRSEHIPRIQEVQASLYHVFLATVRDLLDD